MSTTWENDDFKEGGTALTWADAGVTWAAAGYEWDGQVSTVWTDDSKN